MRAFLQLIAQALQMRLELFSLETGEAVKMLTYVLMWLVLTVVFACLTLTLISIVALFLFWQTARLEILIALCAFYAIGSLFAYFRLRTYFKAHRRPFKGMVELLKKDYQLMKSLK